MTLFAAAVVEFGRDGDELLAGNLVGDGRLKRWFAEVLAALGSDERALLRFLSVTSGPFGRSVVRAASSELGLADGFAAFEALQRTHLVETPGRSRWSVHRLIAAFCVADLSYDEHQDFNGALANHYLRQGEEWPNRQFDDFTFAMRVTGCRHLLAAGRYGEAERVLRRLSSTAKARGRYDTHMRLIQPILGLADRDRWMDYDYAHCCFVLGRLSAAMSVLGRIDIEKLEDPRLRLSLSRVKAEVLLERGDPPRALKVITEALAAAGDATGGTVWSQAAAIEARVHLEMGNVEAVERVASELLARAHRSRDGLSAAVGFTYLGYAALRRNQPDMARGRFEDGVAQFREANHQRGRAWALSGLAEARLESGDESDAVRPLWDAVRIRSDVAEVTRDYLRFLEYVRRRLQPRQSKSLVLDEIARVRQALEA